MPLFKKGHSGNLAKKTYNDPEKPVESASKSNGEKSKTPPRPPKNIPANPLASVASQQSNPHTSTSRDSKRDDHTENPKSVNKPQPKSTSATRPKTPPKFIFYCQLAQGSPTCEIQGFTNVKELYAKISECYKIDVKEVT